MKRVRTAKAGWVWFQRPGVRSDFWQTQNGALGLQAGELGGDNPQTFGKDQSRPGNCQSALQEPRMWVNLQLPVLG